MFEHLRYEAVRVVARSAAGIRTEKILMINDDESLKYRELVLGIIKLAEDQKHRLEETIRMIDRQSQLSPALAEARAKEKEVVENDLAKIEQHLVSMGAGPV